MRLRMKPTFGLVGIAGVVIVAVYLVGDWMSPANLSLPRGNYSQIEDGLYLGGVCEEPPPGTRAVLNVGEIKDPYQAEVHRWRPIPDVAPAPSIDWLRAQVEFVDTQRRAGLPVYVHCQAGYSRSTLVLSAYLMQRDNRSRDDVLAFLRTKRPNVGPNAAFMALLLRWEQEIAADSQYKVG